MSVGHFHQLAIDVVRGRYQPRREFDEDSLKELAASIRTQGSCSRLSCARAPRVVMS